MTDEKKREQGEVAEPDEAKRSAAGDEPEGRGRIAAEDVVGAEETPTERQLEREQAIVDEPVAESEQRIAEATAPAPAAADAGEVVVEGDLEYVEESPRVKPEIPGMDLEVDIVREGEEALREDEYGDDEDREDSADEDLTQPIADASIDLAAGARYAATGKRKTAVARVILKPGTGVYEINGRTLDVFFPRPALQRTIRTALETVGLEEKIDVVATMHGGGVSAQAGALRHGISRALVDADPNLRSELKRRGFLTRDSRVKERKKAGLKKARKRPQFSKR